MSAMKIGQCDVVVESLSIEVFKDVKMGCLRTWFSGGAGLTVGLDNFKVLFQPKCFYDSMIL